LFYHEHLTFHNNEKTPTNFTQKQHLVLLFTEWWVNKQTLNKYKDWEANRQNF
jgi:hypothetical protein